MSLKELKVNVKKEFGIVLTRALIIHTFQVAESHFYRTLIVDKVVENHMSCSLYVKTKYAYCLNVLFSLDCFEFYHIS